MRGICSLMSMGLLGIAVQSGCADPGPPPSRVIVPPPGEVSVRPPFEKPLPPEDREGLPSPPFDDVPIVSQATPEQRAFVDAYEHVGRPRILVFVNRSLEGDVVPVSRLRTNGPGEYRETTDVYLHPGEYDEAFAKSIDYEAMENILTDWVSSRGRVAVVSPTMARQRLSDQQVKDLQSGRPRTLGELARQLDADVLIQVQAHATRQAGNGPGVRLVAEAMNLRGGESIGRAVLDVPPPLDKPQLNKYTRFMARKLMNGMIGAWESFGERPSPAPSSVPAPQSELTPAPTLDLPTTGPTDASR